MSTIEKARLFAIKAHGEQKYGEFPYSKHLDDVQKILEEYSQEGELDEAVLTAAYLHDTIEDTPIKFGLIFEEFGRVVARLVYACTNERGYNRKERHERTYPKLMAAGRDAIAIKLADRIANTEHSLKYNHDMFLMYQREYESFKRSLHLPGELKKLWARLDVLMETHIEPPKKQDYSMVVCGIHGCTKMKPENKTMCRSCYEEYKDDPDAFK